MCRVFLYFQYFVNLIVSDVFVFCRSVVILIYYCLEDLRVDTNN